MAEEAKKAKQETVKEASNFLRGTIAEELARDTRKFGSADAGLLKFHGTYQQDDRDARKHRKPGDDKPYSFMVRTRVPGGKVSADQFLTELSLGERLGNGTLRITTRQGFQLHGVVKGNLQETIHEINKSLLTTLAACGDVDRNVMCCPAPHHNDGVHDRMQASADAIARHLTPQTRAYFEIWVDKEKIAAKHVGAAGPDVEPIYGNAYLPRKFKIGIALPEDNCIDVYTQDIGLLGVVEGGQLVGYNVLVGGGLGATPSDQDTFPRLGDRMAYIAYDDVLPVVTAIVMVQRDFGNRADRKRARMKYLVHDWGLPRFKAKVEEYLGGRTLADPHPVDIHGYDDHLGWHPQGDGKFYFGINVENGRIKDEGSLRLKTGLRCLFERFRMPGRLTPQQSILLCDLELEWKEEILALLREHGIKTVDIVSEISSVRRFAMACPALPTCGLAITEAERVMPAVVDELEVELAKLGLDAEKFTIRMTGCPNACARPYTSDIGLVGKAVGRYTILVGGRLLGTRLNVIYKEMVPLREVVQELVPLLVYFKADRQPDESLGDFCHRKGVEDLLRFDAEYKNLSSQESGIRSQS